MSALDEAAIADYLRPEWQRHGLPEPRAPLASLTPGQRDALWTMAQHKYGWTYASVWRELRSYDALVRRGLAHVVDGSIEVEHFEMSIEVASVDGECRRCIERAARARKANV